MTVRVRTALGGCLDARPSLLTASGEDYVPFIMYNANSFSNLLR